MLSLNPRNDLFSIEVQDHVIRSNTPFNFVGELSSDYRIKGNAHNWNMEIDVDETGWSCLERFDANGPQPKRFSLVDTTSGQA